MLSFFPGLIIPGFTGDHRRDAVALLEANGKSATRIHSEAVAETAARIAGRFGLTASETDTLMTAAYLHDIGAVVTPERMITHARAQDWMLDEAEKRHPFLLHQRFSARIAAEDFGITDESLLAAVACHSTLRDAPSTMDMILFIADKLAWDQPTPPPFSDEVENALAVSLQAAVLAYMQYAVTHQMLLYPHGLFEAGLRFLRKERALAAVDPIVGINHIRSIPAILAPIGSISRSSRLNPSISTINNT